MATYQPLHDWNVSPTEAVALQNQLRNQIKIQPLTKTPETIAGCDISFKKFEETVYAGIVVLRLDTLETIEEAGVVSTAPPLAAANRYWWASTTNRHRSADQSTNNYAPPASPCLETSRT